MRKFLITGANGFVGKYLSKYILSQGDKVVSSGIEPESEVVLDVSNETQVCDVLKQVNPTNIIHLAGFSSVKKSFEDPELCMRVNRDGTTNLLAAVRKYCPKAKVLVISSSEVYGTPEYLPIDEAHPRNGTNPYALSRIAQEDEILSNYQDLNIVISRSFNHTGPEQPKGFVLPDFASQISEIMNGRQNPKIVVGNLEAERDFTDVRDVIRAYYLLSTKETQKTIYNVCSGKYYRVNVILKNLIELSSKQIEIQEDPQRMRPNDVPRYYGSNRLIANEIGWNPKIEFEDTIKDTLHYWLER